MQSHATVSPSLKLIFDQYRSKVLNPSYFPATPEETLQARITAAYLLSNASPKDAQQAGELIKRTSTNPNDLARLTALSSTIISWDALEILEKDEERFYRLRKLWQGL